MDRPWRIAGINFDHFHMGDLLRMVQQHPRAEVVALCDHQRERMEPMVRELGIADHHIFQEPEECLSRVEVDLVILCPATAAHAEWTERVAKFHVHVLMEKPFASSLAQADRMIAAMQPTGKRLAINWPLRWYPTHATAHRLITAGMLGEVREVHFYDGNRGPLWHGAGKVEREPTESEKQASWFYRRELGGGSLLDYLGYGTTLGTWYLNGQAPLEVCCMIDEPAGLEVDEHSITIARYPFGLSKFETRWGTLSDPWTHQPLPKCGFVIRGTEGALSSYDFEPNLWYVGRDAPQGRPIPADELAPEASNPIAHLIDGLENEVPLTGPLNPTICRIGQQIVDTAYLSAQQKRTLPLLP